VGTFAISVCIGCGCNDVRACCNEVTAQPCAWIRLDRDARRGVCTECEHMAAQWDAWEYATQVPM